MQTTAEISMYPLREDFIPAIDAVIAKLNSFDDIKVDTVTTATILIGEYGDVMSALEETIAWSYDKFGTAVFAIKVIPGYAPSDG